MLFYKNNTLYNIYTGFHSSNNAGARFKVINNGSQNVEWFFSFFFFFEWKVMDQKFY